ncbi:DNA/RNA helicase domain-containing protein [Nonomuraea antimicrobica]
MAAAGELRAVRRPHPRGDGEVPQQARCRDQQHRPHRGRLLLALVVPRKDGTLVDNIRINGWNRPWNVQGDEWVGDRPPHTLWATHPGGHGQIGCIYTAQGFEYAWAGVIFGPDLVWRDGGWQADISQNRDRAVENALDFDFLVRNTYRVLATRGMRGTVLHSVDRTTNVMLAKLGARLLDYDGVPMNAPR